jgi:hypothetical protein
MRFSFVRTLFALSIFALLFTSCEEDSPGGGGMTGNEEIVLSIQTSAPAVVEPGDTIYVTMEAEEGPTPLNTITVTEDDNTLPLERVLFDGVPLANPLALTGADKVAFTKEVGVIVSTDPGDKSYGFRVADEEGNSKGGELPITVAVTAPVFQMFADSIRATTPGSLEEIQLLATKGTYDLSQIRIDLDGVTITDMTTLQLDNEDFVTNPQSLPSESSSRLESVLTVGTPDVVGNYVLTVSIIDSEGNETSQSIQFLNGTTPINFMGSVFFNQAGAQNGGMDLDNGVNVRFNSSEAEIADLGIDDTIDTSTGQENWFKKIEPVNGSAMAKLVPGMNNLSEAFTFESIQFTEDLISLVDNQTPLEEGTNTGAVSEGDMFIVSNGANTKVYVFVIREVNEVSASNDDNYVIDIKTTR